MRHTLYGAAENPAQVNSSAICVARPLHNSVRRKPMSASERRKFLKLAGVGAALTASAPSAQAAGAPDGGTFDVRKFGATGDGKTIDTAAINKAIEAAASAGGGTREDAALQRLKRRAAILNRRCSARCRIAASLFAT